MKKCDNKICRDYDENSVNNCDVYCNVYDCIKYEIKENKMKVNYAILNGSMVLNFDGQTINLNKADVRFNTVLAAIKEGRLEDIPELLDNTSMFNQFEGVEVIDEEIFYDGKKMPHGLSKRIFEFAEEGIPFEPLIKFFAKLKENTSYNSREMLYKFLEHNGHPITQDGNFIAYRGVTNDFKDCHSGTFDNSVGAVCKMDRSDVDENPNNTCSAGLHVACYDYANGFGSQMIEVEVNPKDVVAVPTDYEGTKMRCCEFKVVNVCKNERQEVLYDDCQDCGDCSCEEYMFDLGDIVEIIEETGGCYVGEVLEVVDMYNPEFCTLEDHDGDRFDVHVSQIRLA